MIASRGGARGLLLAILLGLHALPVHAGEWYEDYLDGVRAIEEQRYEDGLRLVLAAKAQSPKAAAQKRAYGVRFIEYLPEYHLGVAYLGLGDRGKALEWLERAEKDGEVLRTGRAEAFRGALEKARAATARPARTPEAEPSTPAPATPAPATPAPTTPPTRAPEARPSPAERAGFSPAIADAERAVQARRLEDALAHYERAREIDPESYQRQGLERRAGELSRNVIAGRKAADEAQALLRQGRLVEARAKAEEAERLAGPATRSSEVVSEVRRRQDEYARSRQSAEREAVAGGLEAARTAYRRAAEVDPQTFARDGLDARLREVEAVLGRRTATPAATATVALEAAATPSPSPPPAATPAPAAAERTELRAALLLLYRGDAQGAVSRLEALVRGAGQSDAGAHGYLGVGYGSLALTATDAGQAERLRGQALDQLKVALRLDPGFDLPERLVSPRIRAILAEAKSSP